MGANKLVIEATLNELLPKSANPNIPHGPQEIADDAAACAEAGASLLHFSASDAATGIALSANPGAYRDTVLAMRDRGLSLPWYAAYRAVEDGSLAQIATLARDSALGLAMAAVEVGTDNVNEYNPATKLLDDPDVVEVMAHTGIRHFFDACRESRLRPYLGIKEPGQLRHIGCYLDLGWLEPPVVLKFSFSDFAPFGLPPAAESVGMYVEMIDMVMPGVPVEWFVACNGPSIWELAPAAIAAGGHVRVGLGQYHPSSRPDLANERPTNAELVARIAGMAQAHGRELASPAEARAVFGLNALERA